MSSEVAGDSWWRLRVLGKKDLDSEASRKWKMQG